MKNKLTDKVINNLPLYVFLLFTAQIAMDVLSYWSGALGWGNALTLLLRFGLLGLTLLLGFFLCDRKKVWFWAAGILGVILAGHVYALFDYGCSNLASDLINYVRVVQMPLMVLCLITFMKANEKCYDAMVWGLTTCLFMTFAVQLLAVLTGTEPHTYGDYRGYIGWFQNTNSQSSNLCMLAPVAIVCVHQKAGLRSPLFWVTTLGSFVVLFNFGTRLAYLGLVLTMLGLGVFALVIHLKNWKSTIVFVVLAAMAVAMIPMSPMAKHQSGYEESQSNRQESIDEYLDSADLPEPTDEDFSPEELEEWREEEIEALTPIYEKYVRDFVEIFGLEKTMEIFNYTYDINELTATRPKKLLFAQLLMNESPISAQLFGLELSRFTTSGKTYDVENDLHAMYYLYGWVGLIAMVLFLAYFVALILWALVKNAKRYITWDAVSWGIAFLMALPHIYCTAGVLRRPNASIYLSAALAAVYYLVKLRRYPDEERVEKC